MKTKEILKQWHDDWAQSSLFGCFDNCEHQVAAWWLKKIAEINREVGDKSHEQGRIAGLKEAKDMFDQAIEYESKKGHPISYITLNLWQCVLADLQAKIGESKCL
jgi:hypothetical protein